MLVPPTLPYNESEPIPPGYHLETKKNKALIISGLSLFGLAYAISLGTSLIILSSGSNDAGQFAPLLIPVAGPFITMGTVKGGQTIFLVDGITQTVGAVLLGIGIFKENPLLVRDDIKLSSAKPQVFIGPSSATLRWRF